MKTRLLKLFLISLLVVQFSYLIPSSNSQIDNQENNDQPTLMLTVEVFDIDITQRTANLKFFAVVDNIPYNKSSVVVSIGSVKGSVLVYCNNTGNVTEGIWRYIGLSEETSWILSGSGEIFPFDSYILHIHVLDTFFGVLDSDMDKLNSTDLSSDKAQHSGIFMGSKSWMLDDVWNECDGSLPIVYLNSTDIVFGVQRTWGNIFMLFMQFMVPPILCYYLLGVSNLLNPKKLSERLRISLAIFFFIPTFLFAIQNFLPYRFSLTLPELLLYNLIISNTIFAIFSIIGHERRHLLMYDLSSDSMRNSFLSRKYDVISSMLSLLVYTIINLSTVANKFIFSGFISLNVVVLSYFVPIFIAFPSKRKRFLILYVVLPNIALLLNLALMMAF